MILIDASYINTGGGKTLLNYFITSLKKNKLLTNCIFILDNRFDDINIITDISKDKRHIILSNEFNRLLVYKKIFNQKSINTIFCFNNIPPICSIKNAKVYILFHNTILLKKLSIYNLIFSFRILLKFFYIQFLNKEKYIWIVQTNLVKNKITNNFKKFKNTILVLPFFHEEYLPLHNDENIETKFIYVADASPHKNHNYLLDAWLIIFEKYNLRPFLFFTFNYNQNHELANRISSLQKLGLNIYNLGVLNKIEIINMYNICNFLIYPSLEESFGLPLIEASQLNKFIIAIDLPYVKEIIKPTLYFSPDNINSLVDEILKIFTITNKSLIPSKIKISNNINNIIKLLISNN